MKNLYKSLADFQQSCPVILKESEGYGYSYADLPTIYGVIMPLLKKNGLGFTQILRDDGIETILFHIESGECLSGFIKIPDDVELAKMNPYQVMGSAYSYFRRYALSSMLGIVTDKDNDAAGEKAVGRDTPKAIPTPKDMPIPKDMPRCSICEKTMTKIAKNGRPYCLHKDEDGDNIFGEPIYDEPF